MALQATGFLTLTPLPTNRGSTPGFASLLMDSANDAIAMLFDAPRTGNIRKIGWRTTTVTLSDTLTGTIQALSSGAPSGTPIGGNFTRASLTSNTTYEDTLSSDASVTRGTPIAFVLSTGGGTINIAAHEIGRSNIVYPRCMTYNGSAWAVSTTSTPLLWIEYSDGVTVPIMGALPPVTTIAAEAYSSASTPDERGNRFVLDVPATICGFEMYYDTNAGNCTVSVYNAAGSAVLTRTVNGADVQAGATLNAGTIRMMFSSDYDYVAGEAWKVAVAPDATSQSIGAKTITNSAWLPMFGFDGELYSTTRTDAGSWTDSNLKIYDIVPIFSRFGDDAGGGGGNKMTRARLPAGVSALG
jgi:hypothetical protein